MPAVSRALWAALREILRRESIPHCTTARAIFGGATHQVLPRSRLLELLMRSFFRVAALIAHFERRRVFRPILAPIVQARRCDVGVTQPLLHLRDVGLVLERISRRGGAQRVRAD